MASNKQKVGREWPIKNLHFLGGMIGLFVGASFLSFLELFLWILKLFFSCVARHQKI